MRQWPSAVIFDLDGTLADTVLDLAAALNVTLAGLGLPPHAPETVRTMVGGGLDMLLDRGLTAHGASLDVEARAKAGAAMLAAYAASPAERSCLYPGAADALAALRGDRLALGVCTNKPHAIAVGLLATLGVAEAFGAIQGSASEFPKKPHPASLLAVVERLGVKPERAVMVGDSGIDVATARAASLGGIVLVRHGYSRMSVEELGADAVIESLAELPATLASLATARALT